MTAADQGWMVDDGACDACAHGDHFSCARPEPFSAVVDASGGTVCGTVCCCDEGEEL